MKKFYRLNQNITAKKLRVIDDQGKQVGVMEREEALFRARQQKKDLVEIAPEAKPPVCKIIDFNKFRYLQDKKEATSRKKPKGAETKEVRFSPFIAKNDYQIRIKRIKKFLKEGHKVRITVKFRGRQLSRKQFGYDLLNRAMKDLGPIAQAEQTPRMHGFLLTGLVGPLKHAQAKNS